MLLYEIQMNRVGEVLKLPYLPFDNGPLAAADTLIAAVKKESAGSAATVAGSNDSIAHLLSVIDELQGEQDKLAEQLGILTDTQGGAINRQTQAEQIRTTVAALAADKGKLSAQMAEEQSKLSQLSEAHKEVAAQLQVRQDREAKLSQAKTIIDPTQGEVFVNPSNDIVLRLFTLSFAAGKSEITDQHLALLEKVKQIIALFPESKLVVEGHTDDRGDATANTQLSEKRAFAVMQYLRQAMSIPSDRIRAIGYGSEKPIAPQSTPEGRAKNRRIDILIMQ
jgi:outer membrane protein OmpA-like peptidoglycan-associated protein